MAKYNRYKYIYPPKPEIIMPYTGLNQFEKYQDFMVQPKLNGTGMLLFTNGKILITMNKHKESLSHSMNIDELIKLHKKRGWMILYGVYMNKNNENNQLFNKFVIFDILVYRGIHLLKTSFSERYNLLKTIYPLNKINEYLYYISENCLLVNSFTSNFLNVYNDIPKNKIYDGLILKNINGNLEDGISEKNNTNTQLKCIFSKNI